MPNFRIHHRLQTLEDIHHRYCVGQEPAPVDTSWWTEDMQSQVTAILKDVGAYEEVIRWQIDNFKSDLTP